MKNKVLVEIVIPKLDERYVISMEEFKALDKPKRLCLKKHMQKNNKKVNFR